MKIEFTKMHGAGNDFIVVFDASGKFHPSTAEIKGMCSRNRGIGADGLMILSHGKNYGADFRMDFFNSDGSLAGMCGNGLRCAGLFCHRKLRGGKKISISTGSGILEAVITGKNTVQVKIPVKEKFREISLAGKKMYFGSTGVPHLVVPVKDIRKTDVCGEGRKLRFHRRFAPAGTNVDFIGIPLRGPCRIRTYERGVEGETSACGTGITAAAVVIHEFFRKRPPLQFITVEDDILKVEFCESDNMLTTPPSALLTGPAAEVYSGTINI
ncbi:MAG TPA: diaminopimelate epimerase [Lentisphaeria bacterium]|nr:MAG: diaminopimelate epimerase [Lentisphaerae bacterium GWF2_50_93]HCE45005.1 diaminopimelate epimerase [Lentisphaeria bacterium]